MSLIYAILVAFIQTSLCQAKVNTFKFGSDEGRVAFAASGKIGVFEKLIRIPIVVPQCEILTYVRVDVDSILGSPKVDLDVDMSTVVIEYSTLQISISSYTVTAKTKPNPNPNCRH